MLTHPRISVSAMSSVRWSFDEDLALWRDLGLGWAGLIGAKLGDGIQARIAALADAGPLELELVGPLGDSEGYEPVIRRGVAAAEAMLAGAGL
jgi:hypothetical protein